MKVDISSGQKAVVLLISNLRIKSKNFFLKSCSVWYTVREYVLSVHLAIIWSKNSNSVAFKTKHQIKQFLIKVVQFGMLVKNIA